MLKFYSLSFIIGLVSMLCSCQEQHKDTHTMFDSVGTPDTAINKQSNVKPLLTLTDSLVYYEHLDTISNKLLKTMKDEVGFRYLHYELDSVQRKNWSHKIMGMESLYGAYFLSKQHSVKNIQPYVIYTTADDWGKAFLITVNSKDQMIDFVQVTDSYGDATSEEDGSQIVYEDTQCTYVHNDTLFSTHYGHYKTVYKKGESKGVTLDSIIDTYLILSDGKIKLLKLDSTRLHR